ncbi:hypothetical protein DKZ29_06020 [Limosilactobacillus reuteri]|uniref:ParB N-terminal domain-containing protein n=1 Tax=Limosilactobacillus reuteri TaxID=1598 RepID=UPI000D701640|nr:ParB N-terminal domain-containing protein [Limosilactobacillus reuteri]PWT58408.1 hypothetical protein DKZ29_06020 [Limosilactobacillus reuteri]
MEVKNVSISKIKPYENNPRDNEAGVDAVANSIKEFGWQQPIVVDKDNVIIVGHTRYKAAKKLGMDKVPIVIASNLSEQQVKAYRLADNKTGELTDWDINLLDDELNDILDIDMSDFGFDEDELNFPEIATNSEEVEEDKFNDEPPADPVAKSGQVYRLGKHFVMCGDSTDPQQVKKLMRGGYS